LGVSNFTGRNADGDIVQSRTLGVSFVQHYYRKKIETAVSLIEQTLPKSIHAVTAQGFELKVILFVVAYSLNCCFTTL
jgi:hypothetical protein